MNKKQKITTSKTKINTYYKANKVLMLHVLTAVVVFYFLIHPLTMVMYWFEFYPGSRANLNFSHIFLQRALHAFSFHMSGMSFIFLFIGTAVGLGSGIYNKNIRKKSELLFRQQKFIDLDIEQTIRQGENEYTEFKSSIRYDYTKQTTNRELEKAIAKSICGFMNIRGGKLIIGVSDKGEVLGLASDYGTLKHKSRDGFERRVYEIICSCLGTEFTPLVHIYFQSCNDKDICTIGIEKSDAPVFISEGNDSVFYIRIGNATVPLTVKETVNYLKLNKIKSYTK